ncbi:MAG: serine/threonine protein kinase [Planctomycetes bacterium]|nr:serine/threonine protein kinase [Planctomycetota bacterium]
MSGGRETRAWGRTTAATRGPAGAPALAPWAPPERVGPYRVVGPLGRGGMSVVVEAEHEVVGRRVALKLAPPGLAAARLLDEARLAARARHPGAVDVLDAGVVDGHAYLAMDLVAGETLEARLARRGRLDPEEACRLLAPVVAALAHAHRARIVHRDVKPSNVLVRARDGQGVLADFGVACDLFQPSDGLLGTATHMAPEQRRGEPVGPACDVWALGVTLHECLTGRLPWPDAGDLEALALAQATGAPPPLRALAPEVSPALERVVLRCLERRPEARWPDAGALLVALQQATRPRRAHAPTRARLGRRAAAALLVTGLAAGAAAHAVARLVGRGVAAPGREAPARGARDPAEA